MATTQVNYHYIDQIIIIENEEYLQRGYSERYKELVPEASIKVVQEDEDFNSLFLNSKTTSCFHLDMGLWRGDNQGKEILKQILERSKSSVVIYTAKETSDSVYEIQKKNSDRVKIFSEAKGEEDTYFPQVVEFWNNYLEMQSEISNKTIISIESCINKQGTECIGLNYNILPQLYEHSVSSKEKLFIVKNFLSLTDTTSTSYWFTQELTIVVAVNENSLEDFWVKKEVNNLDYKTLTILPGDDYYTATIKNVDSLETEIDTFAQNSDGYSLIVKHIFLLFFAQNLALLYDNEQRNQGKWKGMINELIPFSDKVISLEYEIMTEIWEKFTFNNHDLEKTKEEMKYLYKQGFMEIENIFYCQVDEITKDNQAIVVLRGVNRIDEPFKRIFSLDLLQKNQIKDEKQCFRLVGYYPESGKGNFGHSINIEPILSETLEQKKNV